MKTIESSAKNVEDAIASGLAQLGASISDVTIDILQEGSKGLFGLFGSRQAKVRLTMKDEQMDLLASISDMGKPQRKERRPAKFAEKAVQQPQAVQNTVKKVAPVKVEKAKPRENSKPVQPSAAPKARPIMPVKAAQDVVQTPSKPVEPAVQVDPATPAGKAQQFLQTLTKLMEVNVSVAVLTDDEGNVRVNMQGDTLGILIGRRGETLDALQYLTSLKVNRGAEGYTRVTLDTENYRAKREEALTRLANRMANRAVKTGRRVSLEPMNPYERRILHSALQQNEAVETHSEGEEPNRHIVITLKKLEKAQKVTE